MINVNINSKYRSKLFPILLSLVTLILFTCIELRHPYFFFQDDNRGQFLPDMLHCLRALMQGELPLFNFHQHLGTPVSIQYAALYPFNYIALLVSKAVMGHYFATMEILAAFHLLLSVIGGYYFLRVLNLNEVSCCFGALTWTFCGFVITVGDSWYYILGYAAYLPWILLFSINQISSPTANSFMSLILVRSLSLFLGSPQFFAYTALFELIVVSFLCLMSMSFRRSHNEDLLPSSLNIHLPFKKLCFRYAANYLLVIAVSLPLLLQSFNQVKISYDRQKSYTLDTYLAFSYNIKHWLLGIINPFTEPSYKFMGDQHAISHVGYLTIICIFAALFINRNKFERNLIWFLATTAFIALMWAGGTTVTEFFYHLPIYNRFRWPFKLAMYTSFFLVVTASFGFERISAKLATSNWQGRSLKIPIISILLILHLGNLMALHMYGDQHMLSSHTDSVPLEEPLQNFLSQGRIVSVGHDVIHDGDKTMWGHSLSSIGFNYATLWGLYHFGGNDALLPLKNFDATLGCNWRSDFNLPPATTLKFDEDVPLEYFRAWGVRWYVVDSSITIDNFDNIQLSLMDRYRKILYDSLARPLVYWGDTVRNNGIESTFTTNSVIIRTNRNENAQLVLAVLHNPSFAVYIDGKPASYQESTQQQITLDVPLGSHSIRISYVDKSFIIGLYISIATILSLFTYLFIYIHRVRMIDKKTSKQ